MIQQVCKDVLLMNVTEVTAHFAVACSVTWPLNGSEAVGDLVLIPDLTASVVSIKLF